jgi:hypothetical protein
MCLRSLKAEYRPSTLFLGWCTFFENVWLDLGLFGVRAIADVWVNMLCGCN